MTPAAQDHSQLQKIEAIVIGASAGAVMALSRILPSLQPGFHLPVFVVVHQPADKTSSIADFFRMKCALPVKEAEDKEPIAPGTIYFAPPDYHLLVEKNHLLSLSSDELVNFSRPSIDVLFESAADSFADRVVGIVLTGASADGARGLRAICERGGIGLVESPELAEVSVMPAAAAAACSTARKLSLDEIASFLQHLTKIEFR
ncbi:MAG: chemotaxis protein CheB [Limisphaerales bacterium]